MSGLGAGVAAESKCIPKNTFVSWWVQLLSVLLQKGEDVLAFWAGASFHGSRASGMTRSRGWTYVCPNIGSPRLGLGELEHVVRLGFTGVL